MNLLIFVKGTQKMLMRIGNPGISSIFQHNFKRLKWLKKY